jgi:hypothetical protein
MRFGPSDSDFDDSSDRPAYLPSSLEDVDTSGIGAETDYDVPEEDAPEDLEGIGRSREPLGPEEVAGPAYGSDSSGEARERFLDRRYDSIVNALDEAQQALREVVDGVRDLTDSSANAVSELAEDVSVTCPYVKAEVATLRKRGAGPAGMRSAMSANVALGALRADAEERLADLQSEQQGWAGRAGDALRRLLGLVKRALRDLWNIISGLLTPKEWTLKGGLKIPLLADAAIEIKFGE